MSTQAEIGGMLEEALRFGQSGDLVQAEKVCRRILAINNRVADAWNMLAMVQQATDRLNEAADSSLQATALRPQIPPYWLLRGNIALEQHDYREAQACFARAVELQPSFAEAQYRLGLALHRQHRIVEAIGAYQAAARFAPDVAEIHFKLAEALLLEDRWEDALRAFESAFARDPNNALPRGSGLNLINHLQWEALPDFWQSEITRYFARDDIDKNRNVSVGLRALKAKAAFRAVLATKADSGSAFDIDALNVVMGDTLFLHLLRDALIASPEFESLLTRLRAEFLFSAEMRDLAPLEFLVALAMQCFNNEYIYAESPLEREAVAALVAGLGAALQSGRSPEPQIQRSIAVVAMYRPLDKLEFAGVFLDANSMPADLSGLLRRAVLNPATERKLRETIAADASISDEISLAVRDMYEEHPYPRWFAIDRVNPVSLGEWTDREAPMAAAQEKLPDGSAVLVAGCGTGHEASELAAGLADARVIAIDLSRTSLAYARRMADELGLDNIEFRQGDILGLGKLSERFAMIYCNGVLHHMQDPQAGLRVLAKLLKPGGLLRLSLYSERARASVTAARTVIRESKISSDSSAIREFRQFVVQQGRDSPLAPLGSFIDFYSMSMCRDLMFHVQEHQMRLPQIAAMLEECGLKMLGFTNVPPNAAGAYRHANPDDVQMTDFSKWDAFEAQHPYTFDEMYQFWCQAPR